MLFAQSFGDWFGEQLVIVIVVIVFYAWLAGRFMTKHPAAAKTTFGFLWRLFK